LSNRTQIAKMPNLHGVCDMSLTAVILLLVRFLWYVHSAASIQLPVWVVKTPKLSVTLRAGGDVNTVNRHIWCQYPHNGGRLQLIDSAISGPMLRDQAPLYRRVHLFLSFFKFFNQKQILMVSACMHLKKPKEKFRSVLKRVTVLNGY
jgi:hypothetical protein